MTTNTTLKSLPKNLKNPAPELPPPSWLGWMGVLRQDPLSMLTRARAAGDLVRLRIGVDYVHVVNHPDSIKHILQDNNRNYSKDTRTLAKIKLFSGENIFTGEGEFWLKRRRLMQPMFHRQQIASFGDVMSTAANEMLDRWAALPPGQVLDMDDEMMRVTLQIVGRALFSVDLTGDTGTLGNAFTTVTENIIFRIRHPFYLPLGFPTPRNRRALAAQDTITSIIQRIIRERLESGAEHQDLLALLMSMRDAETGEGLTEDELGREISTMVFAGHETTSNALTWAWYLLSQHPDAEARLYAEIESVVGGRAPTMQDVPNLVYTRQVLDETMRLYPPAWVFGRQALEADTIGAYTLSRGDAVLVSPYTMHRHPAFWDSPDTFKPERFDAKHAEHRPRFTYLPFGGGPRLCIGQPFALAEATLLLATIAQRYRLRLAPGADVKPDPQITLGVAKGLPMILVPR